MTASASTGGVSNPTSLSFTDASSCSVDLAWQKSASNDDVMIAYNYVGVFGTPINTVPYSTGYTFPGGQGTIIYQGSAIAFTHSPLFKSTPYHYKIWSKDASNNYSSGLVGDTATNAVGVPASLSAAAISTSQIDLTWTLNSVSDSIIVAYSLGSFQNPIDGVAYTVGNPIQGQGTVLYKGTATSFSHSGLTFNTNYNYKIWSFDCAKNYSTGLTANATTFNVSDPTNFIATAYGTSQIDLSWTKNAANNEVIITTNFTGSFSTPSNGTPYLQGGTVGLDYVLYKGPLTSKIHSALSSNTTYYYKIWSVNASNYYSNGLTASATTGGIIDPDTFYATAVNASTIDLDWIANTSNDSIIITYNTVNNFATPQNGVAYPVGNQILLGQGTVLYRGNAVSSTNISHIGLNANTTYYYKVWSYNAADYYSSPGILDSAKTDFPGISIFPNFTDFESQTPAAGSPACNGTYILTTDWVNVIGDNNDWIPRAGTAPYTFTGPTVDHTLGSAAGKYIYTAAYSVGNYCYSKTSYLVSPLYNFSALTNPKLEFYYFMYGATMGKLSVQVSTDGGATWSTDIFSKQGQQQTSNTAAWGHADLSLSAYAGMSNIKLRITSLSGISWSSDIAVDDIKVYQPQNMAISSITTLQDTLPVVLGATNQQVIKVKVETVGAYSPLSLTNLNFTTTGTTALSDIHNARVYYTGSNPSFSTTQSFGSVVASPGASFSVSGTKVLAEGINYFWLSYDIQSYAVIGNYVDASCTQATISATTHVPTVTSPTQTKVIVGQVTVGTGTANTYNGPIFPPFYDGVHESIYLASEIGVGPKEINKVQWYKASGTNVIDKIDNISIYMKNSATTSLADGNYSLSGYTLVYQGPMPNDLQTGWLGVILDNTFLYDGYSNIHLLVVQQKPLSTWNYYPYWSYTTVTPNKARRAYSFSGPPTSLTATNQRPNARFEYVLPQPMAYLSATCSHPSIDNVAVGSSNQEIVLVKVETQYTGNPLSLTSLSFNTSGSTSASDISSAKVYYTGTSTTFSTTTSFGSAYASPNGAFTVTGTQALTAGENYFWLVYDISSAATINNVVDASCTSFILGGNTKTPTNTSPTGNRKIKQYLIVGTGTNADSDQPVHYRNNHAWEGIYLQSEMGAAKDISALAFYKETGTNIANQILNVTIYMKHTSASSLVSGGYATTGYTQVYSGNFPNDATSGWMEVDLDLDFSYNGTDNLEVLIVQSSGVYFMNYPFWRYNTVSPNRARYANNNSSMPTTLNASDRLANIRFEYAPPQPMSYVSSTTTQNNNTTILKGINDQEIIGVEVVMLNSANPKNATSFTFSTAGSSNAAIDIATAKVFYTGNSSTFAATNQFGSLVANPNGTFTVTGTQTLQSGTNYFWLAYDIPTSAINGDWVDAQCTSMIIGGTVTTPTITNPLGNRTVVGALAGYYTIGASGAYASFTDAIAALNTYGISDWVTFRVQNGTYTEKISLGSVTNASITRPITFESLSGDSNDVTLTYSSSVYNDAATVRFNTGANNFIFKNMTISATGTYGHAVEVVGSCSNIVVRNNVLNSTSTQLTYGAAVYSYPGVSSTIRIAQNNITAQNNAVYIRGNSTSSMASGWEIDSNIITAPSYGLYLYYAYDFKIRANQINITNTGTGYAVISYYVNYPLVISSNRIKVETTSSAYGIYLYNVVGSATDRIKVNNNFIANTSDPFSTSVCLYTYTTNYVDVFFNNCNLTATTSTTRAAYYDRGSTNAQVKNNNFIASGGGYTQYYYSSNNTVSNYNNMYSTGTLGYFAGTITTDIAAWKTASSGDANSVSMNPNFVSTSDLHVQNISLDKLGTPITGITTDIDGTARHSTLPDIGADEFGSDIDAGLTAFTSPLDEVCGSGSQSVKVNLKNFGLNTLTGVTINWKIGSVLQSPFAWTGSLAAAASQIVTLGNFNFPVGTTDVMAWTSNPNDTADLFNANDTINTTVEVANTPTVNAGSDVSLCASSYTTSTASATNYTNIQWTTNGTGSFANGNAIAATYYPSAADFSAGSMYLKVEASNAICGSIEDSMLLTISQPPVVSFTGLAANYCANEASSSLVGTPAGGVFSGTGISGSVFNPYTAALGANIIKYVYVNGACSDSSLQTATVKAVPVASFSGLAASYCNNDVVATLTGSPAGGVFSGSGISSNTFDPATATLGTSSIIYNVIQSGCSDADTQYVMVNEAPTANAGTDQTISNGTSTSLTGSATGGAGTYNYSWTPIAKLVNAAVQNPTTTVLAATTVFELTATNSTNSCNDKDQVVITVTGSILSADASATPTAICSGSSTDINALASGGNGVYSYAWSSNPAGYTSISQGATITPTQSAWYKVVVTSGASSVEDSVYITVNPVPVASFTGLPTKACTNGDSVLLTGIPSGGIFSGSGIVGNYFYPDMVAAGTYSITYSYTNSSSCTDTSKMTVHVYSPAIANAGTDQNISSGTSTSLSGSASGGSGSYTYAWTPAAKLINANIQNPTTLALTTTTNFMLNVTDVVSTCVSGDEILVTVNTPLSASTSATPNSVCVGTNAQLNVVASGGTGTYTYTWTSNPAGFNASIANPVATPTITTTYTVAVYDGTTTVNSSTVVTVLPSPNASFSGLNSSYCNTDASSTLVGSPVGGTFSGPGISGNQFNPASANLGVNAIVYSVTLGGCTDIETQNVTVYATPTANAGVDQIIASGTSTTLNGSATGGTGSFSYSWTPVAKLVNANLQNPTTTALTAFTTFELTATNIGNSCFDKDQVNANVTSPVLSVIASSSSTTICLGDSIVLNAIPSGGTGVYTYAWSSNPAGVSASSQSPIVYPIQSAWMKVFVTSGSLSAEDSIFVTVNPTPIVSFSGLSSKACTNGGVILLTGSPSGGTFTGNGITGNIFNPSTVTVGSHDITYSYTNALGCSNSSMQSVTVYNPPIANAGVDQSITSGSSTLLSGSASAGSGSYSYSWTPTAKLVNAAIQNPTTIALTTSAIFTLHVIDVTSTCADDDDMLVSVGTSFAVNTTATPNTICKGSSSQLNATALGGSGSYTYVWTSSPAGFTSTISNPVVTPNVSTTYYVGVNDGTNTVNSSVVVTVIPMPVASFSGLNATYCDNDAITTLVGSPIGGTFSGNGITSNQFNPATANIGANSITYSVTVNGCTDDEVQTTTVNAAPIANAGVDQIINSGTSTTLNGSASGGTGTYTYSWTPAAKLGNANIQNPSTTVLTAATIYELTATNSTNTCSDKDQVTISVTSPTLTVVGSASLTTLCAGNTTTLNALASGGTGAYSYAWSSLSGFTSTQQSPVVTPTVSEWFKIHVVSGSLQADDSVFITVNPLPTITIIGLSANYCNNSATVSIVGTPAGGTFSGPGISGNQFNPAAANLGNNTIMYQASAGGCTNSKTQIVQIHQTPLANAGTDIFLASPGSTTLSGSSTGGANVGYSWSPIAFLVNPNMANPSTVVLNASKVFTLQAKDTINNCYSTDNMTVTVGGVPLSVSTSASPSTICNGDTSFISSLATGGSSAYSYSWSSSPSGFASSLANVEVTPSVTTTYTVTVTSGASNATSSVVVTVNPVPTVTFSGLTSPVCANGSVMTLVGSPSGGVFSGTGVSMSSGSYVFNPSIAGAGNWNVNYVYTNAATSCSNSDNQSVTVNPNPIANAGADQIINSGQTANLVASASGAANYAYAWSPATLVNNPNAASTSTIVLTTSQIFSLQVEDTITGCLGTDNMQVTVGTGPVTASASGTPTSICSGNSSQLNVLASGGTGVYIYSWTSTPAGFTSNIANPIVSPTITTIYQVQVSDGTSSANSSVTITVNASPTVNFTGLDTSYCQNGSIAVLIGSPSGGYFSGNGVSSNTFNPATAGVGYHTIEYSYTAPNTCTSSISMVTHVYDVPTANAGSDQGINSGASATLNGSATGGTGNYSYSWIPAANFSNPNLQNPTTNPLTSTTLFTLNVTDQISTCTSSDNVLVTIGIGGPLTINPTATPDTICAGEQVQLNAYVGGGSGSYLFAWTSVPSGYIQTVPNPVASPTVTTSYVLNVFDGVSMVSDTVKVVVGAIPTVSITSNVATYCANGANETLVASPSGGLFFGNGMSGNVFSPSVAGVGTHEIVYSYTSALNCSNTDTVYAQVQAIPLADAGFDIAIPCNGSGGLIGSNPISNMTYLWTPSNGLSQPTMSNTVANPTSNTVYTLNVTSIVTNCSNSDQVLVSILGGPSVIISNDTMICNGEDVTISASGNGTSYLWSNGVGTNSFMVSPNITTVYVVTVTDASACAVIDSVMVTVNTPYVFLGPDITILDTQSVMLDAGFGYVNYTWNTGDTVQSIIVNAYINAQLGINNYVVEVEDAYGCTAKDSVNINYLLEIETIDQLLSIKVYPNPSKGKFALEFDGQIMSRVKLEMMNSQGQRLFEKELNINSTGYSEMMDMSTWAKGVYLIRLSNEQFSTTRRLIIQ